MTAASQIDIPIVNHIVLLSTQKQQHLTNEIERKSLISKNLS